MTFKLRLPCRLVVLFFWEAWFTETFTFCSSQTARTKASGKFAGGVRDSKRIQWAFLVNSREVYIRFKRYIYNNIAALTPTSKFCLFLCMLMYIKKWWVLDRVVVTTLLTSWLLIKMSLVDFLSKHCENRVF